MSLCHVEFFSRALGKMAHMNVLLPDADGPCPTVYLLHGNEGDHQSWLQESRLIAYARAHRLAVVLPDGQRSRYVNSVACGRYEDCIVQDVIGYVERTFPVRRGRDARGIGGYSMGGYGAMMLGLKHPDVFAAVSTHSGSYSNGQWGGGSWMDAHPAREILVPLLRTAEYDLRDLARGALASGNPPAVRFDCGVDDFLLPASRHCHAFLDEIGYPHVYEEFPGGHDHAYWDARLPRSLAFLAEHVGA